ncbi:MAG TPA: hypothetical protein VL221_03640 [Bacteroidota bacterium]|nr:hypothetical protein [Bacteroidota bacterium]
MNSHAETIALIARRLHGARWGRALLACAALLLCAAPRLAAQDIGAATKPLPDLKVLLIWAADTTSGGAVRYNVYRKPAASANYPAAPLNAAPLGPITDTTKFTSIIPRNSDDWNFISSALADSLGGKNPVQPLANVFAITTYPRGSAKWLRVQMLAAVRPTVALVMGQAYVDSPVVNGTAYKYRVLRVNGTGTQLPPVGANEVAVTAGVPAAIPAPSGVRIVVGDAKLQLLWQKPSAEFSAFVVYRSPNAIGPFLKVNDVDFSADVTRDIDSAAVSPAANGFTDYERWDTAGNPAPRTVQGNPFPFTGPVNGVKYWYRVAFRDVIGNVGTVSATVAGTAVDKTPPMTPQDVFVEAIESNSSFRIRWSKVRLDIDGHRESVARYNIYRYAQPQNPGVGAVAVLPPILQPGPLDSTRILIKDDSTSGLRSPCLDSTLYFRVEAVDAAGNVSRRSVAVSASLRDTTRPAVVQGTTAEGFDDYIKVKWVLNTDCGIDAYLIYRSLCDRGKWYPCYKGAGYGAAAPAANNDGRKQGDCGGPFVLIGVVPQSVAKTLGGGVSAFFDDHTVPAGSPLCYAYIVKAQDHAQNISGTFPVPLTPPEKIVCQRLRDRTPPPPAIVAGLSARDSAIQVDYIGPPVQDIAAYHVYRSDTSRTGSYHWVGGMTVVPPPGTGVPLAHPYVPPPQVNCDSIPLVSNPYMSAGSFVDHHVERKHIYWYKVLGIDRSGNESPADSALAISTFTFASGREVPPQIVAVTSTDNPCALTLSWTPGYDTTAVQGFLVFRGTTAAGDYFQLEGLQKSSSYADPSVARNTTYFYRVVALRRDGMLTSMSDPKSGSHP